MDHSLLERAQAFIKGARVSVIATTDPTGAPHVTVMHHSCSLDPLSLYYSADRRSTKYANVMRRTESAVAVGWSEVDWVTVQMRGKTTVIADPVELAKAKATHYQVHPNSQRFKNDPDTVFLKFSPNWIRFSDLAIDPPIVQEIPTRA